MTPLVRKKTRAPLRDAARTRTAILASAHALFSTRGYAATGVRDIGQAAGINPALCIRYFGSKKALFAAVLDGIDLGPLFSLDRARFAEQLVQSVINVRTATPLSMVILSTADPEARAASAAFIEHKIIPQLGAWLGKPDGQRRAAHFCALWMGFLTSWQVFSLKHFDGKRAAPSLAWIQRVTQAIVDEA